MSEESQKIETRIDMHAVSMFKGMGYNEEKLPDSLVQFYNAFKTKKDKLFPGRLTAEGFATVAVLSDLSDGLLVVDDKEEIVEKMK